MPKQTNRRQLTADELRQVGAAELNKRDDGGRGLFRTAEVRAIDEDKRTVELAFSSEAEVPRWFGIEVLDHSDGAMRTERLTNGAALLVNHDWDDQVGVVESASIGDDRRGRAVVRFGKSVRANEIWEDVRGKIRQHVSVGYIIHKYEVEENAGQADRVIITDWEPLEISIVAVPADTTVGVGRSMSNPPEEQTGEPGKNDTVAPSDGAADNPDSDTEGREMPKENEPVVVDAAAERQKGEQGAMSAVRTILKMGEQYDARELAAKAIEDGKSPDEFQRQLLDEINKRASRPIGEQTADAGIGLDDKEVRSYSFLKVVRALSNPTDARAQKEAAFEIEAGRAAAERMGKEAQGIIIPADVLGRAFNSTTTGTAAGDTGGYAIATELMSQSFVDMLRNRNTIMQLGFTMGGLVGNVDIPRQVAGAQGYWVGEDVDATEGAPDLDQISLSPKTVAAYTDITRKLMQQSSIGAELLVRRDLANALATAIDLAGYYGTGSANQPRGIVNYAGINAVDFGGAADGAAGDDKPTFAEFVQMETEIAADNADVNSMAYVLNSRMRGHCKTTEKFAGTSGATIWEQGNTINGYRTEVTNQIADDDVIFGNFADLIVGMWGGLDLTVDPYSKSKSGGLRLVVFQDVDFVLRRLESFCLGRDAS